MVVDFVEFSLCVIVGSVIFVMVLFRLVMVILVSSVNII